MTAIAVSLGQTLYSLRFREWSSSELADDMSSGLVFWAGLIFVPPIGFGIVQSARRRGTDVPVVAVREGK